MRFILYIMVVASMLLPFLGNSQSYYNIYFINKRDTVLTAIICAKNITEAKFFANEVSKEYGCVYSVKYWKRRPKGDTKVNYLIWK